MEIEERQIDCGTNNLECVKYSFNRGEDNEQLERFKHRAESLADDVNPAQANTSQHRNRERRIKDNIVGQIAEYAWKDWIKKQISKLRADYEFIKKDWDSPEEQVDLILTTDEEQTTFEIRASCTYAGIEDAVCEYFDIIGWYENATKQGEKEKDYYLRSVFNYPPSEILNEFDDNGLNVYLTGGASAPMLHNSPHAVTDNMDAGGPVNADGKYRLIRPISNGLGTDDIIDEIL